MKLIDNLADIFQKGDWEHSVKAAQKDMSYMFKIMPTKIYDEEYGLKDKILYINVADMYKFGEKYFDAEICNNKQFANVFDGLCKTVIDRDFKLLVNPDTFMHDFIQDSYGSGVEALFWAYFHMVKYSNIKNIVIDNIDGFLHHNSMEQFCRLYQDNGEFKLLFLMNNYTLFTTSMMEIKDLYIIEDEDIANIQDCTERELRPAHNLEHLLKAGEFEIRRNTNDS